MIKRLITRLFHAALLLLAMSFVIYFLIGLMPGDPVDLLAASNPKMNAEDVRRLRALHGLDQPLFGRYLHWLGSALQGDFGYSRLSSLSVGETLVGPLFNTLFLMLAALCLSLLLALPLGIVAALRYNRSEGGVLNIAALAAISIPVFWLGLMMIIFFAVHLAWLPAGGVENVGDGGVIDRIRHLILPVATLGLARFGLYFRYMRASMIEALHQDWIRTARAKGLSWPRTALRHGLRSALIPVATIAALDIGTLFSGVLVTETVFAYPGMGKLIYDSVLGNDYNLALAALLLAGAMTLIGNLAADVVYTLLDPRIRFR